MLAAFATSSGWDGELHDAATAVSEACNNVVRHAYADGRGPLAVSLAITTTGLEVSVADRGRGLAGTPPSSASLGVGLALIAAVADAAHFDHAATGGTEVVMTFAWARPDGIRSGGDRPARLSPR